MKVLDLFSGLGGFSEAFVNHGCDVIRIENNPLLENVPHTQLKCVLELRDYLQDCKNRGLMIQSPDVVLASPPCLMFSNAYNAPKSIYLRKFGTLDGYEPDMTLLEAVLDIVKLINPRYWIIENVHGAGKYFEKYLGKARQCIGAYSFWGNFPLISGVDVNKLPTKHDKDKRHSEIRANHRAYIPIQISQALLIGILQQQTIFDYLE